MVHFQYPLTRDNWSLDVVNILAFLGEHNILETSQQICMSRLCFLPRLIPAPQGLLAQRARSLPSEDNIKVRSIKGDNHRLALSYFANILHGDGAWLKPFTTRVIDIRWKKDPRDLTGLPIRPRLLSPLNVIAIVSCAMSFGIAAWAIVLGDAAGLTGVAIMSLTTPLLCIGLKWTPYPHRARSTHDKMEETVVFRLPKGTFTVVRCDHRIAGMLYFHTTNIEYLLSSYTGRGVSGIAGGMTLVGSLVLFSNAMWTIKAALVAAYTVLNLLYWLAAILPARWSWHMPFEVEEQQLEHRNYTTTLWSTIHAAGSVTWVMRDDAVTKTPAWAEWLEAAERALSGPREAFDPQMTLMLLLNAGAHNEKKIRTIW
jgi:hypothetical protein